jgi:starvation-inducible DNA-binding protein
MTATSSRPTIHTDTKHAHGESPSLSKGYPAPAQLSTPTDLPREGVEAITEALNPIVADSFALYVKTKNYHWHLAGSHFRGYHLMFDEQADQIFGTIDVLAERVRKIGGTTLRSIGHIAQLQSVKDCNADFVTPLEMLRELIEDNRGVNARMRKAHELCDTYKDVATASLLEVFIDATERRIWFLYEASQGADHTR